jgi:hypothetical protein
VQITLVARPRNHSSSQPSDKSGGGSDLDPLTAHQLFKDPHLNESVKDALACTLLLSLVACSS